MVFVHAQLEYQLRFTRANTVRTPVGADMVYFCKTFVSWICSNLFELPLKPEVIERGVENSC